jgi:hypothetical protein
MFHIYDLTRPEVEHVLDSFFVVRRYEGRDYGEFRTKRLVLERYDAMAEAARVGSAYQTIIDPLPGHGPHPSREALTDGPRHNSSTLWARCRQPGGDRNLILLRTSKRWVSYAGMFARRSEAVSGP